MYKKLSFKVHPDKNHARGAEEAFKKLSEAHKVLSDADLRQRYNVEVMIPHQGRFRTYVSAPAAAPARQSPPPPAAPADEGGQSMASRLNKMLASHRLVELKELCRRLALNATGAKAVLSLRVAEKLAEQASFDAALEQLKRLLEQVYAAEQAAATVLKASSSPAWGSASALRCIINVAVAAGVAAKALEAARGRLAELEAAAPAPVDDLDDTAGGEAAGAEASEAAGAAAEAEVEATAARSAAAALAEAAAARAVVAPPETVAVGAAVEVVAAEAAGSSHSSGSR